MKREPMLGNESFQNKIMNMVRQQLEEGADQIIDHMCEELRQRLNRKKSEVVGKLIQAIDIFTDYDIRNDRYIIHVTIQNDREKP